VIADELPDAGIARTIVPGSTSADALEAVPRRKAAEIRCEARCPME
jgi:hypothetical protein